MHCKPHQTCSRTIVQYFERSVEARRTPDGDAGAEIAGLYELMAAAYSQMQQPATADEYFARSVATLERAMTSLPRMRDMYAESLSLCLRRYADFKRRTGDSAAADVLVNRAAAVAPRRGIPMPEMKVTAGTPCLGSLGPLLTETDVRAILELLPKGAKPWLILSDDLSYRSERTGEGTVSWTPFVLMQPRPSDSAIRRGDIVFVAAVVPSEDALSAPKTWKTERLAASYAQVLLPGREPNDIRGQTDLNQPFIILEVPSDAPSDTELIELVQFLREQSAQAAAWDGSDVSELYKHVQPWPIKHISRSAGGFRVDLWDRRTLDGYYQSLTVKHSADGWKTTEWFPGRRDPQQQKGK